MFKQALIDSLLRNQDVDKPYITSGTKTYTNKEDGSENYYDHVIKYIFRPFESAKSIFIEIVLMDFVNHTEHFVMMVMYLEIID